MPGITQRVLSLTCHCCRHIVIALPAATPSRSRGVPGIAPSATPAPSIQKLIDADSNQLPAGVPTRADPSEPQAVRMVNRRSRAIDETGHRGVTHRADYLIERFRVRYGFGGGWTCGCPDFAAHDACRHTREAAGRYRAQTLIAAYLEAGAPRHLHHQTLSRSTHMQETAAMTWSRLKDKLRAHGMPGWSDNLRERQSRDEFALQLATWEGEGGRTATPATQRKYLTA